MSNRSFIILSLRLIIIFLLVQSLSSVGAVIYSWAMPGSNTGSFVGFQLSISVVYFICLIALFKFENPIADKVLRGVSETGAQPQVTSVQIMSIVLAGVAAFIVLSSIPALLNQSYLTVDHLLENRDLHHSPMTTLNELFLGGVASLLKIAVALTVFYKPKSLAALWEKWQSRAA